MLRRCRVWSMGLAAALLVVFPRVAAAAYTITGVTGPVTSIGGREQWVVTVTETGVRDTSEVTILGVPVCGTIVSVRAKLTAGTGTTVHTRVGTAAAFVADSYDERLEATATAAQYVEVGSAPYCSSARTLYLRSAPNSVVTDHAITTELIIVAGAQQ